MHLELFAFKLNICVVVEHKHSTTNPSAIQWAS